VATFYPTLAIKAYRRCPPDCRACEAACAEKMRPLGPAILASRVHEAGVSKNVTCFQCGEPECIKACPADAIVKSEEDGVVRVIQDNCIGCEQCVTACPYGNMYYSTEAGVAFKCDLCGGEPKCVDACKHKVLSFVKTRPIFDSLRHKDLLSRGTTLCMGCPTELALRIMLRVFGENTILIGCASCAVTIFKECSVPASCQLFTNVAPVTEGIKTYYRRQGREVEVVAFVGDGATADAGFQSLSGVAVRGEKVVYICYDNEAYMNTGIQQSSTTPYGAWTFTTPVGKRQKGNTQTSKYMPLLMAFHGIPYAATATVSYLEDYVQKLTKAKELKKGMAYIHLLSPCPVGWRAPVDSAIEMSRMAVETNYFPLWECANGKFRLTYRVENRKPIPEFTRLMGRFSHLKEEELQELQKMVDNRFALIQGLCKLSE